MCIPRIQKIYKLWMLLKKWSKEPTTLHFFPSSSRTGECFLAGAWAVEKELWLLDGEACVLSWVRSAGFLCVFCSSDTCFKPRGIICHLTSVIDSVVVDKKGWFCAVIFRSDGGLFPTFGDGRPLVKLCEESGVLGRCGVWFRDVIQERWRRSWRWWRRRRARTIRRREWGRGDRTLGKITVIAGRVITFKNRPNLTCASW